MYFISHEMEQEGEKRKGSKSQVNHDLIARLTMISFSVVGSCWCRCRPGINESKNKHINFLLRVWIYLPRHLKEFWRDFLDGMWKLCCLSFNDACVQWFY